MFCQVLPEPTAVTARQNLLRHKTCQQYTVNLRCFYSLFTVRLRWSICVVYGRWSCAWRTWLQRTIWSILLSPFYIMDKDLFMRAQDPSVSFTGLISRCLLFASVGQVSVRIIASLPWTLFMSLLTHRLVLLCIDDTVFIFGICQGMSWQHLSQPQAR